MDVSQDPSAFEPSPDISINVSATELEPENERDSVYYLDTIVLKVENMLFRVPKHVFQVTGCFFEKFFSLPRPEGRMVEGSDDAFPLPLRDISKAQFRAFLRVLYPLDGTATTYEEWVGALDLATRWDFKQIRKASVRELSKLIASRDVVENILLAKKYRVKQWLQNGYLKLIQQIGPVKIDELHSLNLDWLTIARICSVRETTHVSCCCGDCKRFPERAKAEIAQIFADEMKEMEDFQDVCPQPEISSPSHTPFFGDAQKKKKKKKFQ